VPSEWVKVRTIQRVKIKTIERLRIEKREKFILKVIFSIKVWVELRV